MRENKNTEEECVELRPNNFFFVLPLKLSSAKRICLIQPYLLFTKWQLPESVCGNKRANRRKNAFPSRKFVHVINFSIKHYL